MAVRSYSNIPAWTQRDFLFLTDWIRASPAARQSEETRTSPENPQSPAPCSVRLPIILGQSPVTVPGTNPLAWPQSLPSPRTLQAHLDDKRPQVGSVSPSGSCSLLPPLPPRLPNPPLLPRCSDPPEVPCCVWCRRLMVKTRLRELAARSNVRLELTVAMCSIGKQQQCSQ